MAKGKTEVREASEVKPDEIHDFVEYIDDPMLNFSEAERLIGKSKTTIRRWADDGLIRVVRDPSGLRRVRKSELVRFYNGTAYAIANPIKEDENG